MDLQTLFKGLVTDVPAQDVVDITQDSRTAVRDGLFIACRGTRQHGLDFVGDALRAGVGAVAWEPAAALRAPALPPGVAGLAVPRLREQLGEVANRFFARPSEAVSVTGITGTNGKTTTAWLVMQAIARLGGSPGYVGTLGHGRNGQLRAAELTTPDCISFHRQLRELADEGATHVVAEVSSHALDQERVAGVRFGTVAFTNLSRDHLDYHADLAAYGAAKARLFALGAGTAVINLDDPFGRELANRLSAGTRLVGVTLAGAAGAMLTGTVVATAADGLVLELSSGGQGARLQSPLWGRFNAENLLVAAGILLGSGWPLDRVADALGQCGAPPGRMERVPGAPGQPAVLVDFAHTPDALRKALAAVREHCTGEVWCVFGCGGDRDRGKRAPMGEAAVAGADRVIVTDDNPRTEDPQQIIADILGGVPSLERLQVVPERAAAIGRAIRLARPGDAVLVAGKGHETVQVTGGERRPFSDVAVARAALLGASGPAGQGGSP
ncbi:MAG: UDP-N-acetylmuramoyl-L-alanyl-D-glutamate--2,6-diaminopimelate ligase [Chromatiales bacterium]|nr:UDP-N-acetylmuramoyl-L-alanyl-D-glutamate--2,6-diaminopimelate ligase [Chromatiales bacterium]